MSRFAGGDSVLFKRGQTWATGTAPCLQITKTGLTSYLTFGAYGTGVKPILSHDSTGNGEAVVMPYSHGGVTYIRLDNLDLRIVGGNTAAIAWSKTGTGHLWVSNCDITGTATGIIINYCDTFIIEDCYVHDTGSTGIGVTGTATSPACNGIIRRNVITNTGANDCITLHKGGDNNEYDIGSNFLLEDNVLSGAYEDGIDITSGSDITIRRCEAYNNSHAGFGLSGQNVLVERCYIHDNPALGFLVGGNTNGFTVTHCIIENSGTYSFFFGSSNPLTPAADINFYNTTIYHTSATTAVGGIGPYTNGVGFKNNIVLSNPGASKSMIAYIDGGSYASTKSDFDHTLWWQSGRAEYSLGTNSRFADPQFIDVLNGDYRLLRTSPAIDAGCDVNGICDFDGCSVPQGLGPDIGAFEYAAEEGYTLTVIASNGTVIKDPDQATYTSGQVVTLTAAADTGFSFGGWSDGASGTSVSTTITMDGNKSVTAVFTADMYTLSTSAVGGSVTRSPDQTSYTTGTVVTLQASANAGYTFTGWSGALSGAANPTPLVMNADKSVTANFTANTYTLAVAGTNGSVAVVPQKTTYTYGETVSVQAVPSTEYHFTGWSGDLSGNSNPVSLVMNGNKSVTAGFAINTYTLNTNATNGSVTASPDQAMYNYGETVNLQAVASDGYEFTGWSGALSGAANPATLVMNADKSVTATFVAVILDKDAPVLLNASPAANAIQTPLNSLVSLHIADAGEGVDANTVSIAVNGASVYSGNVASYTSESGVCRRVGTKADYTYAYQPAIGFDYDTTVTVTVDAADLKGNAMAQQSYSFRTQMRAFGANRCAGWGPDGVDQGGSATVSDASGNLWVVYHAGTSGARDIYVSQRANGAAQFGNPVQVTNNVLDQCDPDIAIGTDGRLYVVWQDNQRGNWDICASTSADGVTWSSPVAVTDSNDNEIKPAIVVDSQSPNRAYVTWGDGRAGNQDIYVAVSSDRFVTKMERAITSNALNQTDPRIAVNASNTVYIVWTDSRNETMDVYGAASNSGPWSNVAVATGAGNQFSPVIAAEPSGSALHFAWVSDAAGDNNVCYGVSDGLPTSPLVGVNIIDDSLGADQVTPAIVVAEENEVVRVFVCWQDARNVTNAQDTDIYAAEIRAGDETNLLVGDGGTGTNQSEPAIAVDSNGRPYIVWTDDRNITDMVYCAASTFVESSPLAEQLVSSAVGGMVGVASPAAADDVSVVIPAGACPYDVTVSVAKIQDLPAGSSVSVLPYEFGPSGLLFIEPVTITVPYLVVDYGTNVPQPYWYDALTGTLTQQGITNIQYLTLSPTVGALRFQTTHFTPYTLVADANTGTGDVPPDSNNSSGGGCSLPPGQIKKEFKTMPSTSNKDKKRSQVIPVRMYDPSGRLDVRPTLAVIGLNPDAVEYFIPYCLLGAIMIGLRRRDTQRRRSPDGK